MVVTTNRGRRWWAPLCCSLARLLTLADEAAAEVAFNAPFQVVRPTANHSSMLPVHEGLQMLAGHREKIAVLSVVGPYHSGKSFLLNALIGDPKVFTIGRRTDPETMGIWMCRTNLKAGDGSEVWLLDSEGFFGPGVSESYDAKIFTIASLLGGHLVYNTVKIIDQQAVSLLEMLARRTQLFRTRSSAESASARTPEFLSERNFPPLTWVVEDFVQELPVQHRRSDDGATAWLRSYLSTAPSKDQDPSGSENQETHFLARLSENLKVHTLFLPATSKEHLQDLSKLSWDDLTPEFREEVLALKKRVLGSLEARTFEDSAMTGATFERSLRFIVQALQRGMFHELPSLWSTWTSQVAEMSLQDSEQWFVSLLQGIDTDIDPIPVAPLNAQVDEARKKVHAFYKELLRDFEVRPNPSSLNDRIAVHFQQKQILYHERVLRWVGERVVAAKDVVGKALAAIDLPVDPEVLKRHGENTTRAVLKEFSKELQAFAQKGVTPTLGRAAQMPVFPQDPIFQLTTDLRHLLGDRENDNEREITQVFKAAVTAADETVEAELKLLGSKLLGRSQLKEITSKVVAEKCWKAFNSKLESSKWMMKLTHYRTHKALVQTEMYERRVAKFVSANEQRLSTHFRTVLDRCTSSYQARKNNLQMPVSEGDLEAEHRTLAQSIRDMLLEQSGSGAELQDTDAFRGTQNSLNEVLETGGFYAMQKNVELWKVHADEATRCALRLNDETTRQCGLSCLYNKVPAVHKKTSQKHLIQCIPRSGAAARMSPAMQQQVFNTWYAKDLARDAAMVWNNFYIGTALIATCIMFLLGGFRGLSACCCRGGQLQQPLRQQQFDPYSGMQRASTFPGMGRSTY